MNFKDLKHSRIFEIFEEISAIPHGSENCQMLADFCVEFAKKSGLKYYADDNANVVIYKQGTFGLENESAIILQGHIDMVCQKTADNDIDFLVDSIKLERKDDFLSANGTTLGGDNGIAVAMILAILESSNIKHPPIEAVFTSDEEIGMIGAGKLDMSVLTATRMINLDAEEDDTVIVSCAGGSDFYVSVPTNTCKKSGCKVTVEIKGLQGGHSGVEINSGRLNSNIISGRILARLSENFSFDIMSINGGDKGNAITNYTKIELISDNAEEICRALEIEGNIIKTETASIEKDFSVSVKYEKDINAYSVFSNDAKDDIVYILACIPNGVQAMSYEINNLVETSLNLGIVKTSDDEVVFLSALRSNKESALIALQNKLKLFYSKTSGVIKTSGFYPPWEYKRDSELRNKYIESYKQVVGKEPFVNAIHAGLECAIFSSKIKGIDCIAIGPNIYDVHTVNERLSLSSTVQIYDILLELLESL